jgi:cytoskeletal protein RodZ
MSKASFGEHLRREREMRRVSLDEICAATRIATRYLQALEKEQWEVLPGGIFNRGFVRAVARFLGLDEDGLVAEYALATNQQSAAAALTNPPPQQVTAKKSRRAPWIISVLAVLLVLGGGSFAWRWYAGGRVQRIKSQKATTGVEQPKPNTPDESVSSNQNNSPSETALSERPSVSADVPQGLAGLQLKIEAGKTTTVTVLADGSKVFRGRMTAGENRTFDAQNVFEISARNPGALLLELNGQTLARLASSAHSSRIKVTRNDLKPQPGGVD